MMFFTAHEAALLAPVRKSRSESAAKLKNFSLFPVGVIAAEAGFEAVFYFSHLFRKYYGIPPKKYREEFFV